MTRRVLISGSVAYDTIMVFDGHFKDHILPEQVHVLNVAFLAPRLKREHGGCAANIAYNLKALGGEPVVLATVGSDGDGYLRRLVHLGIDVTHVRRVDDFYTAQAFITTDLSDNQITAFHPGAMTVADQVDATAAGPAAWGIVAPNGKAAMQAHAAQFARMGVPFLFDPGQGLPMFDGEELLAFVAQARAVAVNDYEARLLSERTGLSPEAIAQRVEALIVTRGAEGSRLYTGGRTIDVRAAPIARAVDPTGCGDAYRGGLLHGLARGWTWERSAQLGSVLGAIKIEHQGPQNHVLERGVVEARMRAAYGVGLDD